METNRNAVISFEKFVSVMQERLQARYPDCKVRTVHADKNNGLRLTGIVIMPEDENLAPNIYMENFYEEYLSGRQMEDLVDAAAQFYEEHRVQEEPSLPDVTDFEAVKDLICFKPVNGERNREMLKSMPHRQFLDLAVTYYIPVTVTGSTGRIAVTDRYFGMWGVDEGTLYCHAVENTRRLLPVELRSMEEVARGYSGRKTAGPVCLSRQTVRPLSRCISCAVGKGSRQPPPLSFTNPFFESSGSGTGIFISCRPVSLRSYFCLLLIRLRGIRRITEAW